MTTDPDSAPTLVISGEGDGLAGRARRTKVLIIVGSALLAFILAGAGGAWALMHRYGNQVRHQDLLGGAVSGDQQQHFASGPINLLILGSDSRQGTPDQNLVSGERSDTIMLVHVAVSRDKASVISIPRDSYVNIPAGGSWPGGMNKINAALAYAGTPLVAKTVAQLTSVPLDGAAIANFAGVRKVVDTLGGVNVCVRDEIRSESSTRVWGPGCHQMSGEEADEFMRQRGVPGGDLGRIKDQQLVVRSVLDKVSSEGLITNPLRLDDLLMTTTQALTIDKSLNLWQLASAVRNIKPSAVRFATVPYRNLDLRTAAGSCVELDPEKSQAMFEAIRNDSIDRWITDNPTG